MEKKLNIIYEILDNIPDSHLFFGHRLNSDETYKLTNDILTFFDFTNFNKCSINEINQNIDQNYYYIINRVQNSVFLHTGLCLGEDLENRLRKNKNLNIIYINESESDREEYFYVLNNLIKMSNLNPKQFYLINNNSLLYEYKHKCNSEINVHSIGYLPRYISRTFENTQPIFKENKKYIFTAHNKRLRSHRYALLSMLKKDNILHACDWSSLENWKFKQHLLRENLVNYSFFENVLNKKDFYDLQNEMIELSKIDMKKSEYEGTSCFSGVKLSENYNIVLSEVIKNNVYKDSYVNITTETCFNLNEIHITEKSFIPINFYQIPLIVASKNHIKKMIEKYDFDMFTDLIDISYDNEEDHRIRLKMIREQIIKLYQNKDKLPEYYIKNKDRFLQNRQKMLDILRDEKDRVFFESLI